MACTEPPCLHKGVLNFTFLLFPVDDTMLHAYSHHKSSILGHILLTISP